MDSEPRPDSTQTLVCVLHYNHWLMLERTLHHIRQGMGPSASVVVYDNASTSNAPADLVLDPRVEMVRAETNKGYAAGFNWALQEARRRGAAQLLFLTHEVVPQHAALSTLLSALSSAPPDVAVVVPAVETILDGRSSIAFGGRRTKLAGRPVPVRDCPKDPASESGLYEVEISDGCALAVRVEPCLRLGGMSEQFFLYYEESEFLIRLRKTGHRVQLDPRAVVTQTSEGTPPCLYARNRIIMHRLLGEPLRGVLAILEIVARAALLWVRTPASVAPRLLLAGLRDAWRTGPPATMSENFMVRGSTGIRSSHSCANSSQVNVEPAKNRESSH